MSGWRDDPRFVSAARVTLDIEGGFVDNLADPGGATNHGVSLRWLRSLGLFDGDIDGDGDIDADDIRALDVDRTSALFYRKIWVPNRYAAMPPIIGGKTFDMAVHMGPAQANRLLQRSLSAVETADNQMVAVADDGLVGDQTLAAVAVRSANPSAWGVRVALRANSEAFFRALCDSRPALREFRAGWIARARR